MKLVPITLKAANAFVKEHHRHNDPVTGHKFSVGLEDDGKLIGVAIAGRPVARHMSDGFTLEVNRTCTDGSRNANSMLYGAIWRAAKALGYTRLITYTQQDESGASLKAVGFRKVAELKPRKNWHESSGTLKAIRNPQATSGVARQRWEISVWDDLV